MCFRLESEGKYTKREINCSIISKRKENKLENKNNFLNRLNSFSNFKWKYVIKSNLLLKKKEKITTLRNNSQLTSM